MRHAAYAAAIMLAGFYALAGPSTAHATVELRQPCPYHAQMMAGGCYDESADTIYYDTGHTLRHERGHAFDHLHLTNADRDWLRARFFNGLPWITELGEPAAGELFAEGFAYCHKKPRRYRGRVVMEAGAYGYIAFTGKHRRLCNAISVLRLIRG